MNAVSEPYGAICFGLNAEKLKVRVGDDLWVDAIKKPNGVALAIETRVDHKAEFVNQLTVEHSSVEQSSTLKRDGLYVEMLIDEFERISHVREVVNNKVGYAHSMKKLQVFRSGLLHRKYA